MATGIFCDSRFNLLGYTLNGFCLRSAFHKVFDVKIACIINMLYKYCLPLVIGVTMNAHRVKEVMRSCLVSCLIVLLEREW